MSAVFRVYSDRGNNSGTRDREVVEERHLRIPIILITILNF